MPNQGASASNQDGTLMLGVDAAGNMRPFNVDANGDIKTSTGTDQVLGYAQISVLSAAVGLGAIPSGATKAIVTPETQAVRWRDDGTAPTAAIGMPIPVLTPFTYTGDLTAIKFIEQAASAKLNVAFYK